MKTGKNRIIDLIRNIKGKATVYVSGKRTDQEKYYLDLSLFCIISDKSICESLVSLKC